MPNPITVVVLGGTGAFGARAVTLLRRIASCAPHVRVVAAARNPPASPDPCFERLDVGAPSLEAELRRLQPHIVVNTVGPFQGDHQPKTDRLIEHCIASSCHYIDLADAQDFVQRCPERHHAAAAAAGTLVVTGASSVPGLSEAVCAEATRELSVCDAIDTVITPGNRAPRGLATIRAIMSYVGKPIRVWREGQWQKATGWGDTTRSELDIDAPGGGKVSLGPRWFSACQVPDQVLFPTRFAVRERVSFRAGLELSAMHLGLLALSLPVRWGLVPSLEPAAAGLQRVATWFYSGGTDRGGMRVEVTGRRSPAEAAHGYSAVRKQWTLVVGEGDGPYTPTLPAVALVRKLLQLPTTGASSPQHAGAAGLEDAAPGAHEEVRRESVAEGVHLPLPLPPSLQPGAYACMGLLSVQEIMREGQEAGLSMATQMRTLPPLYVRACGESAFASMPAPIKKLHDVAAFSVFRGQATVTGASNALGRLAARIGGLPQPTGGQEQARMPIEFVLSQENGVETWERRFAATEQPMIFRTRQLFDPATGCITETAFGGLLHLGMRAVASPQGLDLQLERVAVLGVLPLPKLLHPCMIARERLVAATGDSGGVAGSGTTASSDGGSSQGTKAGPEAGAGGSAAGGAPVMGFEVELRLPLLGRLVGYSGWLAPVLT